MFVVNIFRRMSKAVSWFLFGTPVEQATLDRAEPRVFRPEPTGVVEVNSTVLSRLHHDRDNSTLTVEFRSGRVYQYFDVPETVAVLLAQAESVGQFFNTNVKDVYDYEEVYGNFLDVTQPEEVAA